MRIQFQTNDMEAWERGRRREAIYPFNKCLEECRYSLTRWNKNTFGHVGRKISALQKKLQWTESHTRNLDGMDDIHEIKVKLNKMLLAEEEI